MPVPQHQAARPSQNRTSNSSRPSAASGAGTTPTTTNANPGPPTKNVKRKSSKPIIDWLQRKLAGTVRARRVSTGASGRPPLPSANVLGSANTNAFPNGNHNGAVSVKSAKTGTSSAYVSTGAYGRNYVDENGYVSGRSNLHRISNDMSLRSGVTSVLDNDKDDDVDDDDDDLERRSSGAGVSTWSRSRSNRMDAEADEDASMRPFPPTSPPSPSPSRSSSSYLSNPRTFKSMSASTKPTTLLSIDLSTNGMAHIAQAPPTPTASIAPPSPVRFSPHTRTSSGGGGGGNQITFSSLPPFQMSSSRPSSLSPIRSSSGLQAPQHTSHHPRNNPRPSSPPLDNASVLTLASSAFAMPTSAVSRGAGTFSYAWNSAAEVDSVSQLGGAESVSHVSMLADDALLDRDASLRALRPRSSRRGSWESEASRWSAAVSGTGTGVLSVLGRGGSVRTAPSFRTGGQIGDDQDGYPSLIDEDPDVNDDVSNTVEDVNDTHDVTLSSSPAERAHITTDTNSSSPDHPTSQQQSSSPPNPDSPTMSESHTSSGEEATRPTTPNDDRRPDMAGIETTPKKEKGKIGGELGDVGVDLGSPIRLEKLE